eukprot:5013358-Pleurochrysis_carterae.AAC.3
MPRVCVIISLTCFLLIVLTRARALGVQVQVTRCAKYELARGGHPCRLACSRWRMVAAHECCPVANVHACMLFMHYSLRVIAGESEQVANTLGRLCEPCALGWAQVCACAPPMSLRTRA